MADYRWATDAVSLCTTGGNITDIVSFSNGRGWTDTNGSGSHYFEIKFQNEDLAGLRVQQVSTNVQASWSVSYDKNNRMTVTVHNHINNINAYMISGGGLNSVTRHYVVRNEQNGVVGANFDYSPNAEGVIHGGFDLVTTLRADPGAVTSNASLYGANWSTGYANEGYCDKYIDKFTAGIRFQNTRAWIWDDPTLHSVNCGPDNGGAKFTFSVDYGATLPSSGSNRVRVEVSADPKFGSIVWSREGTGTIVAPEGSLNSNTKYHVRFTAINKAGHTAVKTCEFTTLCRSSLRNPVAVRCDREMVDLSVLYGGRAYAPKTQIFYRKCSESDWHELELPASTQNTTTTAKALLVNLEGSTCYRVQSRTTTTAGTYYSPELEFTSGDCDRVTGDITSTNPYIDEDDFEVHSKVCFRVYGNCTPITAYLEYRIKNGASQEWRTTDPKVYPNEENEDCVVLDELLPNHVEYEVRVHASCGDSDGSGPTDTFVTPLLPKPENHNCENFQYMVDMICQSLDAIQNGLKTLHANEDVKELCDPYSDDPTFAAMWSRVIRFMHGAICVMCDMADTTLKSGLPGQVYMGEIGWSDIDHELLEGSEFIATSDAIWKAIDEGIHLVWHSHGAITYLVGKESDLDNLKDAADGDIALVAENDTFYKYSGGKWAKDKAANTDNFTVYYIEKAAETDLGRVKAHSSWYYFEGKYQQLDVDTRQIEERLDVIEKTCFTQSQSSADGKIDVQHNTEDFDYTTLPDGKRVICFVVEDVNKPALKTFNITYDTKGGVNAVNSETVVAGSTPNRPADPVREGYNFVRWEDKNTPGVAFDFEQQIFKNYDLVAVWSIKQFTVSYDLTDGATGSKPVSVTVNYGDNLPVPSGQGLSKENAVFMGWMRNGILVTSQDKVYDDTVLVAMWDWAVAPGGI